MESALTVRTGWSPIGGRRTDERRRAAEVEARLSLAAQLRPNPTPDERPATQARVVGYAPGVYDLFNLGHLNLLRNAKQKCDYLIVGVMSDDLVEKIKGRRPVIPLSERMEIVRHISWVDEVVADIAPDRSDTWRSARFNVIFKGDDWRGTPKGAQLERDYAGVGVDVVYLPYTKHQFSSAGRSEAPASRTEEPAAANGPRPVRER